MTDSKKSIELVILRFIWGNRQNTCLGKALEKMLLLVQYYQWEYIYNQQISTMPRKVYDEQYINEREMKKGHSYISLKKRLKLIQLVFKQKLTIYKAAKRLKICHPTAKFIIKSYRKGRIYDYDGQNPQYKDSDVHKTQKESLPEHINSEVALSFPTNNQTNINPLQQPFIYDLNWVNHSNNYFILPFYYYR